MKRKVIYALYLFVICLYGVQILLEASVAPLGEEWASVQAKVKELDIENRDLRSKLAEAEAYTTIAQKAQQQGFIDATKYYYIK